MDNTNNKEYWEGYVDYWKERVDTTNKDKNLKDKTLDDKILDFYLRKFNINEDDKVLDFGCGFCRIYPYYKNIVGESDNYFGVDIAEAPLNIAREKYPSLDKEGKLSSYDGKRVDFFDSTFDKIICFGVFDACYQEEILIELLRLLKPNGKLLLTGKNTNYYIDDEEAYIAEVNARKKGHPNYFTDANKMVRYLEGNNVKVHKISFKRRGDFPNNIYIDEDIEKFYEWLCIIDKNNADISKFEKVKFSDMYSETYRKREERKLENE